MVFNSVVFLVFFSLFFILYWTILGKNFKQQNFLLLCGSYFFYSWVDWRFSILLLAISLFNYKLGYLIHQAKKSNVKRLFLYLGLLQGLGGLWFFKYYNFFISSFNDLFSKIGVTSNLQTLDLIIPLGISFFTFRTISYILDIDKGKIEPSENIIIFLNYISFFPSILSGPIDKSKNFIPQLEKKRVFDYVLAMVGLRQILWGLFKKVVIADQCSKITDLLFDNHEIYPASSLLIGAFLYTIQIYADFSGYSDMAIGVGRLIGITIPQNFQYPFFSQNIADFWRRWHITLTNWLTEYVFTPLTVAFRYYGKTGLILAIVVNFTICGIWHGANWTYILFGFLHGCYFIPLIIKGTMNKKRKKKESNTLTFFELINVLSTFSIVMFTFILFRAKTVSGGLHYIGNLFSSSLLSLPILPIGLKNLAVLLCFIIILFGLEWKEQNKCFALEKFGLKWPKAAKLIMYYLLVFCIIYYSDSDQKFIYLKF